MLVGLFWIVVAFAAMLGLCYLNGATNIGYNVNNHGDGDAGA